LKIATGSTYKTAKNILFFAESINLYWRLSTNNTLYVENY